MMLFEIPLYLLLTFLLLPTFQRIMEIEEMKNLCLLFFHYLPFEAQGCFYVQLIEITTHLKKFQGSREDLHLFD
jgi:predicted membrane channel-forming protein YqfA (hemolysin III family)